MLVLIICCGCCVLLGTGDCTCSIRCVFCFKQKTAYEMRISDWSSDVCSSDLFPHQARTRSDAFTFRMSWRPGGGDTEVKSITGVLAIGRASCRERLCQYM